MDAVEIELARAQSWRLAQSQRVGELSPIEDALAASCAPDVRCHISHPFNETRGVEGVLEKYWRPLFNAFSNPERRDDIFVAGRFKNRIWTAATGHFVGVFENQWLNIPPSKHLTFIRFGEIIGFDGDRISDIFLMVDIIGAARQNGLDLVGKSRGAEIIAPGPGAHDGIRLNASPEKDTAQSMKLVDAMIAGLMRYDRVSLDSMHQEDFWRRDFLWYGPSGVGASRGLKGFQDYHQRPFLNFVPDRKGGDHVARFADGPYVASGGWPSIRATTSGEAWVGVTLPPDLPVTMRVMDFWRRDGAKFQENWVFIDIPDILRQCGQDLFAEL